MIKARIIVEGDVQKVGYRDFVQKVARKLGVKGYVENLRNGSVQIICEADEPVLKAFVEAIKVEEEFIRVEKVQVVEMFETSGEFEFFEIKYGKPEEELGERVGTAVEYARAMNRSIKGMHDDVKGVRVDIKGMHDDVKEGFSAVQGEIGGMRGEVNERFDEMARRYDAISAELVRTREELTRAVDGLLKLIEEFIRERHGVERGKSAE